MKNARNGGTAINPLRLTSRNGIFSTSAITSRALSNDGIETNELDLARSLFVLSPDHPPPPPLPTIKPSFVCIAF